MPRPCWLSGHVRGRDNGRELHQRRRTELLEQPSGQLVSDPRGRLGHRLGVLHDVTLQRVNTGRLAPPGHLAGLGLVESPLWAWK